ncbi:MAG: hypothetical protein DWQ04_18560 [Chloroflexi bacterium]|nr:MAG: hypothetical protein DWQ04_18560 [Chloroflexota bacterium]
MLDHIEFTNSGFLLKSENAHLFLSDESPCLIYNVDEADINRILNALVSDLSDKGNNRDSKLIFQTKIDNPIEEIRLDWHVGTQRTWSLPGLIDIMLPENSRVTLSIRADKNGNPQEMLLVLTVEEDSSIAINTNFAWGRDDFREIHNNSKQNSESTTSPFATLTLTALEAASITLLHLFLDGHKKPSFLKQYNKGAVPAIDLEDSNSLCQSILGEDFSSLSSGKWTANLSFAKHSYTLPFLYSDDPSFSYHVKLSELAASINTNSQGQFDVDVSGTIEVLFGTIKLTTDIKLTFNWESLAFDVNHNEGIKLYRKDPIWPIKAPFLGLEWTLKSQNKDEKTGEYHFFTLETKNNNYGIVLAENAWFDLAFDSISKEPIVFQTTEFKLSPEGLSLDTNVTNSAVTLFGLDTKFSFTGSGLKIQRNKIQSFTISGSGPLPPDLVGEAVASIDLQFDRRADGNLTLVEGEAYLAKDSLLACKNTRFQFSVDELGLKFIEDGKFHLYFTITGTARFVLAPEDNLDGPLAFLPNIEIALVQCPLTGDISVLGKHINFLIEFPKPVSFNFLGAFEMELRAIGFFPEAKVFDNDPAMQLTGQLKFAQGLGDVENSEPDYHKLFIGLPEEGEVFPRIHFASLAVNIKMGDAFHLRGVVDFVDEDTEEGLIGEGEVQIQGMPIIRAAFGFLRVRRNEQSPWQRAWFIYAEIGGLSLMIPIIQIYIREIGLGFGYRYTLVSIKAADEANDVKELIKQLAELSKSQGDLAKRDRWAVDLEAPGDDPRWTIVFRALIAQNAAGPTYIAGPAEETLPSMFLFDVVAAFRSDFTFFMAGRGWINTNYHDFVTKPAIRTKPFVSGFLLLSPRQKRFLIHVRSNPDGHLGSHPELPGFVKTALGSVKFSATLLIEPNLLHYELGWPNMLRWEAELGPLKVAIIGGFIFRLSTAEFAIGTNYLARGELKIDAGFDAGAFGVDIYAHAQVAYGARYIGVIDFVDAKDSVFYGGIGLELHLEIRIRFWVNALLAKISFRFSAAIHITAALEVAISMRHGPGLMGRSQIRLSAMGHGIDFTINLKAGEQALDHAKKRTERILAMGLEATDVEALPGLAEVVDEEQSTPAAMSLSESSLEAVAFQRKSPLAEPNPLTPPHYTIFVMREQPDGYCYFVLMPQAEVEKRQEDNISGYGFLPAPPARSTEEDIASDFMLKFDNHEAVEIEHYTPLSDNKNDHWKLHTVNEGNNQIIWKANWDAPVISSDSSKQGSSNHSSGLIDLRSYIEQAFINDRSGNNPEYFEPTSLNNYDQRILSDERVQNPTENAYESAVIGAVEQFRGSPHFKRDPNYEYDRCLAEAFDSTMNIYGQEGEANSKATLANQHAHQIRGLIIHDIVADLQDYLTEEDKVKRDKFAEESIAFQMGLVFRVPTKHRPQWLDNIDPTGENTPSIFQRLGHDRKDIELSNIERRIQPFNVIGTGFYTNPPQFENINLYSDSYTIAITWDLTWPEAPVANCFMCQADPDHHLMHYRVTRRAIDSLEPEKVLTVKPGYILHRGTNDAQETVLNRLKPRFQIVDHFSEETEEERINLPASGRSYIYTITPVDFSKSVGRPLTIVGTRYPDAPPLVPVDGQLSVTYRLNHLQTIQPTEETIKLPDLIKPHRVRITWTEPTEVSDRPPVHIAGYRLIFRKETIIPVGSYGLDSAVQGSKAKTLPSTNARPRPTDIKIEIDARGPHRARYADIPLAVLQGAGIFPQGDFPFWQPQAWRIYIQSVSVGNVPSALAPVELLLSIENENGAANAQGIVIKEREERQPAELEWLPTPINLPILPPEDCTAIIGTAHFPMPSVHSPKFEITTSVDGSSATVANVSFREHPLGIRAIRLRWNQGPSKYPDFPLSMNAGYHLWELNIDAHTSDTFKDEQKLQQALRHIQEIQMVPDEDLWLIPGDTLNPSQWEAWYPSDVARHIQDNVPKIAGSEIPLTPWYSWRESILKWPQYTQSYMDTDLDIIKKKVEKGKEYWHKTYFTTNQHIHAYLTYLVEILETTFSPELYVDLQAPPAFSMSELEEYWRATSPEGDPYGWKALQLLGLSITFSLREAATSRLLTGNEMMQRIGEAISQLGDKSLKGLGIGKQEWRNFAQHLHVELLVKGSEYTRLNATDLTSADAFLALVQVSLRPIPVQKMVYSKIKIRGQSGTQLQLKLQNIDSATIVNQSELSKGEVNIELSGNDIYQLTIPVNGEANLLLRTPTKLDQSNVRVIFSLSEPPKAGLPDDFTYKANPDRIIINNFPHALDNNKKETIKKLLSEADYPLLELEIPETAEMSTSPQANTPWSPAVHVQEPWSTYFSVPSGRLVKKIETINRWKEMQFLFDETLSRYQSEENISLRILPEGSDNKREAEFSKFVEWSQRFFDHGPSTVENDVINFDAEPGPWLATAYAKQSTPTYVTPDQSGRLTYHRLTSDKWGQTYRYYIDPYSRYDLLWQAMQKSPDLFPGEATPGSLLAPQPNVFAGGLDLVIPRVAPVKRPLILRSGRLDTASRPGNPAEPGKWWEVIVSQHPEQALSEQNQTLARQLSYRQLLFTLLRRFAYGSWVEWINALLSPPGQDAYPTLPKPINAQNIIQAIPDTYPLIPDNMNPLAEKISSDSLNALDVPLRLDRFQQGAVLLQWEALPFYYEHRLLVAAQADTVVSEINQVSNQDFEYLAPEPKASMIGAHGKIKHNGAEASIEGWKLTIPLRQLWDSLPSDAKARWADEAPHQAPDGAIYPSAVPDLEVVYQIVDLSYGNIEVQAELYFDFDEKEKLFKVRQLGKGLIVESKMTYSPLTLAQPEEHILLNLFTHRRLELPLSKAYTLNNLSNLHIYIEDNGDEHLLIVQGVLTKSDLNTLLPQVNATDKNAINAFYTIWNRSQPISMPLHPVPEGLADKVRFTKPERATLLWYDVMTESQRSQLLALPGDQAFREAITSLVEQGDSGGRRSVQVVRGPEQPPLVLPPGWQFDDSQRPNVIEWHHPETTPELGSAKLQLFSNGPQYTHLQWHGLILERDFDTFSESLRQWGQVDELAPAIESLLSFLSNIRIVQQFNQRLTDEALRERTNGNVTVRGDEMLWVSDAAPSPDDLELLHELPGDILFKDAMSQLIAQLNSPIVIPIEPTVTIPGEIDPNLQNQLRIELSADGTSATLIWDPPIPSREQENALKRLKGEIPRPVISELLRTIEERKQVVLESIEQPDNGDVPNNLKDNLEIRDGQIIWQGLVRNSAQLRRLRMFSEDGKYEDSFSQAIKALYHALINLQTNFPLSFPVRPDLSAIDSNLANQLTMAYQAIVYHGIMPKSELATLLASYSHVNDIESIKELYLASLTASLDGHELQIRARRGSATPSQRKKILPHPPV